MDLDLTPISKAEAVALHTWKCHTIKGYINLYLDSRTRKNMPHVDTAGVTPETVFRVLGDYFSRKIQSR